MLKPGDKVPDFKLPLATADSKDEVAFSELLGAGDVLISFFPIAFSGTCTEQVCETRDSLHFFVHVNATVVGFSTDAPHVNRAFVQHEELGFPIYSDPNRRVVDKIWQTETVAGVERVASRGMMVVDGRGVVKHVWVIDDADDWPGLDEVKQALHSHHHHH